MEPNVELNEGLTRLQSIAKCVQDAMNHYDTKIRGLEESLAKSKKQHGEMTKKLEEARKEIKRLNNTITKRDLESGKIHEELARARMAIKSPALVEYVWGDLSKAAFEETTKEIELLNMKLKNVQDTCKAQDEVIKIAERLICKGFWQTVQRDPIEEEMLEKLNNEVTGA